MLGEPDPYVLARRVLLDALAALGEHGRNVVVIGAHAVYHWAGHADLYVAPFTTDADLALDPRALSDHPLIESALTDAGFTPGVNPGEWIGTHEVAMDLLIPSGLAPQEGRRGARIPPHSSRAARKASGIEGCVVDVSVEKVMALEAEDRRLVEARIAGPGAMIVAKLVKLGERADQPPNRLVPKDALDIHRLLIGRSTADLVGRLELLLESDISRQVTVRAIEVLNRHFAAVNDLGPSLVSRAIGAPGPAQAEGHRCVALVRALLSKLPIQT